ncbi:MAG TPA: carbonate dehydratase [Rhodospirillaceae bacterium]|nr:MAG: carbonate dehydratase [Alphaproteobacteria bacterium GWF2_58_20]HAU28880.1 carbonate dehydratase [Rhodospirillaceae bacterium]
MNNDASPAHPPHFIWHALPAEQALDAFSSSAKLGLSKNEVENRLKDYGPNSLPEPKRRSPWLRFALQFHNPLIYVLLAAGIVTVFLHDYVDAGVIFGVVIINAIIGFIQEGKAEESLQAVRSMLASKAIVLRNGERHEIDASGLVPGDIVLLESGTRVPADLRLLRTKNLRINEAALTGESVPVEKGIEAVPEGSTIGDRTCMAYSCTTVSFGQGHGIVIGTGSFTEIGRIGKLVGEVPSLATPLTRRLDQFARQITLFILGIGLVAFLFGYFVKNMPPMEIFLAVVGLAVAAIPEGLPAIVTIVLAIGTRVMAGNRALIRRLPAVETLGSVTVICSDKTGTLTKNEMTAVSVMLPEYTLEVSGSGYRPDGGFHREGASIDPTQDKALQALAQCALLCNDAALNQDHAGEWELVGDPTEGALLTLAHKAELDPVEKLAETPRIDEIPFESEHRFMATLHHDHESHAFILLKGAPERILDLCIKDSLGNPINHEAWNQRMEKAAGEGQRVLCLAQCDMPKGTRNLAISDIKKRFTLLGMTGLIDPPREEAIRAIAECQRAGIRIKMITGDHASTAAAIGRQLGLNADHPLSGETVESLDDQALQKAAIKTDIIARASPEHKLRLVAALQAEGELVAMTGDGVNDAPALKAANIGVAMGQKGTDAARESADLVLTDDNFATIARAVREGRVVFDNIKKSLLFILPTNGGEAGVILMAIFAGLAMPVTAGQILWVNMITAVTLAIALAFEPAEKGVMHQPPRKPSEPLITKVLAMRIAYVTLLMILVTFTIFEWELQRGNSIETARTAAVNMLVISELVYLFNVRHFTESAFKAGIFTENRIALWMSLLLVFFQILFTYAPFMQAIFDTTPLDAVSWLAVWTLAIFKFLAVELEKTFLRRLRIHSM